MEREYSESERFRIHPDMTILDIISKYRQTEAVFKSYDEKAGVCLCCRALFETLKDTAKRYGLPLQELITDLETAATQDG
jgi:hypothetical protein